MSNFEEKALTVYVTLNEDSYVQVMLKCLYNDGDLRYDDIRFEGTDVVSDKLYKDLSYGKIDRETVIKREALENEGYQLDYIFTIVEKVQDPFRDFYGSWPHEYFILAEVSYALKLKFLYYRQADSGDETDEETAESGDSETKRVCKVVRIPAPF